MTTPNDPTPNDPTVNNPAATNPSVTVSAPGLADALPDTLPESTRAIITHLNPSAAKLMAVNILLADPASLGDDVLESCLYLLRDQLTNTQD